MVELMDDEHLSDDERWVRHRLEGAIGPTRVTDMKGGPPGQHDLEPDLPDGTIAAIEITSEADQARLSVEAAAKRHLATVTVPSSQFAWLVNVTPQADVRALRKASGLVALLTDMEQQGESSVTTMSDYRSPWRARLVALGLQSVHGFPGTAHSGAIYIVPGVTGEWGWVRATADKWITDFLATELGKSKLVKLARAATSERHLVVLLHLDTEAGLGFVVSDELPSVIPPPPLTHLWLIAPTDSPRTFRWARGSGWTEVVL